MTGISLTINGVRVTADVEPRTHLADFLREERHLTGTHLGCEHGVCGACTLVIDGVPARSCITYAAACDGSTITTVEGLDDDEIARELRAAFTREHALQCGYCTPGMMISARDLVLRLPDDNEARIRNAMSGNLCRCTGYVGIVNAIRSVIAERRARGIAPLRGGGRSDLGPVGSGHAAAVTASDPRNASPVRRTAAAQPAASMDGDWTPSASFARTFTIEKPRGAVWAFFKDIKSVAACLPGVALTGEPTDDNIDGHMRVKLGPINAAFRGVARVTRDNSDFSGTIEGRGEDARSQSATRGRIGYRLVPDNDGAATRVDLTIAFALTGMLAQFSRSGLVQSIVDRMIGTFVENLTARLDGRAVTASAASSELKASSLLMSAVGDWFRNLRARLLGK